MLDKSVCGQSFTRVSDSGWRAGMGCEADSTHNTTTPLRSFTSVKKFQLVSNNNNGQDMNSGNKCSRIKKLPLEEIQQYKMTYKYYLSFPLPDKRHKII